MMLNVVFFYSEDDQILRTIVAGELYFVMNNKFLYISVIELYPSIIIIINLLLKWYKWKYFNIILSDLVMLDNNSFIDLEKL